MNDLAFLLATSRDPALRDGAKAVEYAEKANQLSNGNNAVVLDTLAAAYAGQGRYKEAVDTDWRETRSPARWRQGNTAQAALFQKHLAFYHCAGQPLRTK